MKVNIISKQVSMDRRETVTTGLTRPGNVRVVSTPPAEIRDFGRVKIGDGGTAPARRPSSERQ